jgi:hypothetical protein
MSSEDAVAELEMADAARRQRFGGGNPLCHRTSKGGKDCTGQSMGQKAQDVKTGVGPDLFLRNDYRRVRGFAGRFGALAMRIGLRAVAGFVWSREEWESSTIYYTTKSRVSDKVAEILILVGQDTHTWRRILGG